VGFDRRNTPEGIAAILSAIPRLVPALNRATMERFWAGLRPWCADGAPAIGRLPGCEGVTLASGHFKLGITGCAATAQAVRRTIVEGGVDPLAAAFSPDRFAHGGAGQNL
jgi:glycine oxidase